MERAQRFISEFTYGGADGWPLHAVTVGRGPTIVLLHGGGPDHHSLIPIANRLADRYTVVLPDVRGYGRSLCADPALHTWVRYADDVVVLLDHLNVRRAVVGGTGLGSTVALRTAVAYPERIVAAVAISVEDIEGDEDKEAETALLDSFALRAQSDGLEAAWQLFLPLLLPVIAELVRDAIPRSDRASIVAAAAIGRDRAFNSVDDLATVAAPTLVIPGTDARHPKVLAERLQQILPFGQLAPVALSVEMKDAEDLARTLTPAIRQFLDEVHART